MSFSGKVKEELSRQLSNARHCQVAELAAIINMCGKVLISENQRYTLSIQTENLYLARKCYHLLKITFNINVDISIRQNILFRKNKSYLIAVIHHEETVRILQAIKKIDTNHKLWEHSMPVSNVVLMSVCCKRAFIRGAFLATGSISAPEKFYHFEIVCDTQTQASQLQKVIKSFQIDAKIVERKKYFVVYIKEGSQIADMMNIMEAHIALMEFENIRIIKEMRNSVNRKVNCETANINKTVSAAVKQIEDIEYIRDQVGLSELSEGLEEVAKLRLTHPDASLKELGEMLCPAIGKSGVNHRLRKICEIAESLKET